MDYPWVFLVTHEGSFVPGPPPSNLGGMIDEIPVDSECMSMFELYMVARGLKYNPNYCKFYYLMPNSDFENGIRQVTSDSEVVDMFEILGNRKFVIMFIQHTPMEGTGMQGMDDMEGMEGENDASEGENGSSDSSGNDLESFGDDPIISDDDNANVRRKGKDKMVEVHDHFKETGKEKVVEDNDNIKEKGKEKMVEEETYYDDSLRCPRDPDDDNNVFDFPEFDVARDMKDPKLVLGLVFPNVRVFREAFKMHSIRNGYEFEYKRNDGDRVTVVCKAEGCGWRVHASEMHGTDTFQIKTMRGYPHKCGRTYNNKYANSTWLSQQYSEKLMDDPTWKVAAMKKSVRRDHMVNVSAS